MSEETGLLVRFYEDAWKNPQKSAEAGRDIYDTVPFYEVKVPGETGTIGGPVHVAAKRGPAHDPRLKYPNAWKQWERDHSSEGLVGTPLREVPWLGRGEVETLKQFGVRTLENLAELNDANVTQIPGGLAMRQKAKATIQAAADGAPLQRMAEELAKRDAQIADLQKQLSDIVADRRRTKVKE